MAVLVEATSVIVRRSAIEAHYAGGWQAFVADVPNGTACWDDDIARVGFMSPVDAEAYILQLEKAGLTFLRDDNALDIAVANQQDGLEFPAKWLQFAHLPIPAIGHEVALCWVFENDGEDFGAEFII